MSGFYDVMDRVNVIVAEDDYHSIKVIGEQDGFSVDSNDFDNVVEFMEKVIENIHPGFTPLQVCAVAGYHELAQVLLDAGVDPEDRGSKGIPPYVMAEARQDYEMCELLSAYTEKKALGEVSNEGMEKKRKRI
jgi:hypothetical protein